MSTQRNDSIRELYHDYYLCINTDNKIYQLDDNCRFCMRESAKGAIENNTEVHQYREKREFYLSDGIKEEADLYTSKLTDDIVDKVWNTLTDLQKKMLTAIMSGVSVKEASKGGKGTYKGTMINFDKEAHRQVCREDKDSIYNYTDEIRWADLLYNRGLKTVTSIKDLYTNKGLEGFYELRGVGKLAVVQVIIPILQKNEIDAQLPEAERKVISIEKAIQVLQENKDAIIESDFSEIKLKEIFNSI